MNNLLSPIEINFREKVKQRAFALREKLQESKDKQKKWDELYEISQEIQDEEMLWALIILIKEFNLKVKEDK